MPLINVDEIKVIGNVIESFQRERRYKLLHLIGQVDKKNPVCPVCNENMGSPLGLYNGCTSGDGDDDKCYQHWEFECKNFHNCSWSEQV